MKAFKKDAPPMGKEQFVRYAGVVGDFNPVHYDMETAQSFKMPAVIGQGPLVMTLALDAAIAENGLLLEPMDISDLYAVEVDFAEDLERANQFV